MYEQVYFVYEEVVSDFQVVPYLECSEGVGLLKVSDNGETDCSGGFLCATFLVPAARAYFDRKG